MYTQPACVNAVQVARGNRLINTERARISGGSFDRSLLCIFLQRPAAGLADTTHSELNYDPLANPYTDGTYWVDMVGRQDRVSLCVDILVGILVWSSGS